MFRLGCRVSEVLALKVTRPGFDRPFLSLLVLSFPELTYFTFVGGNGFYSKDIDEAAFIELLLVRGAFLQFIKISGQFQVSALYSFL